MIALKRPRIVQYLTKLFSDENLTKKAFLNTVSSSLEYTAKLIVVLVIQPWLVGGLGDYFYGIWQILQRFVGYITPASGRPTTALRWALANDLYSTDTVRKRKYVGSSIAVWVIFLPILLVLGGLLVWFIPGWINTPPENVTVVRVATAVLVLNLLVVNLTSIPQSVLQGENLGYKRMGASTLLVFAGGGLTWLAVYLKSGIVGVAVSTLALTLITGLFFLLVVKKYSHWFGVIRSTFRETWNFFKLSGWFLLWNLIQNFMMASDVVILGMFYSVESVTIYSLTKYAPETCISILSIITFGVAPGMGGVIGSGDKKKASSLRGETMAITWLFALALGFTLVMWNQAFISLWVGEEYYSGALSNLLIVLVVIQFVLIRNDSNFIDLTLKLQRKVIWGTISVVISLVTAGVLVSVYKSGFVGVSIGLLLGRAILSVGYPLLVGQHLEISWTTQLKSILRPALITVVLLTFAAVMGDKLLGINWSGLLGWIKFLFLSAATLLISIVISFYLGLPKIQRSRLLSRVKVVISRG